MPSCSICTAFCTTCFENITIPRGFLHMFESSIAHCFTLQGFALSRNITHNVVRRKRLSSKLRKCANRCGLVLRCILRYLCVGFCVTFFDPYARSRCCLHIQVFVLQIMLHCNERTMTQPRGDLMRGIVINPICLARPSQILKESRPRFMPRTLNDLVK